MSRNLQPIVSLVVQRNIWLPNETEPVVAGKLTAEDNYLIFNYGKSYLERNNAISLYEVELPLRSGALPLISGLSVPSCIRDAAPDAWGRRVLINTKLGSLGTDADPAQLDELTYLLESDLIVLGLRIFSYHQLNTYHDCQ